MLEPGKYIAKALDHGIGRSGNGTEQIAVIFEVQEGDRKGACITWFGYFSDKAWERTIESLRHCGWKGDDLADMTGLTDSNVEIEVEHDEYNGRTSAKVKWVNRVGGGVALKERLSDAETKALAARMHARIAAMKAKKGATPPAQTAMPAVDDSDVPF